MRNLPEAAVNPRELPPFPVEPEWLDEIDRDLEKRRDRRKREFSVRVFKAMMLAKTPDVCEALLRGESVPLELLDQKWLARFGLKEEGR